MSRPQPYGGPNREIFAGAYRSGACNRRDFLRTTALFAAGAPLALATAGKVFAGAEPAAKSFTDAKVAIAACKTYEPEVVGAAYRQCFDSLGGIGPLVKGKTVTIKINLTGVNFASFPNRPTGGNPRRAGWASRNKIFMPFLDRPFGETYMTHEATAYALAAALFQAGARRVVFVESTQCRASLESTLEQAGWDVRALSALGAVEYENSRNLGSGKAYGHLKVPTGGLMFSSFDVNHRYVETDVMISLCKLKNHLTAGVTLSMKNMFGITPNALYGDEAGDENATAGRGTLHERNDRVKFPGAKETITSREPVWRVPRIIVDEIAARPLQLCVIDGITSMSGGEGPWCGGTYSLKVTTPGVLIVGLNGVSTDAVGTAVMGYADPRAVRGVKPFAFCDNHLLLAEQAGLGTADLSKIDVRGVSIASARYHYPTFD